MVLSHTFQMVVTDGGGFPFPNSTFDLTLEFRKLCKGTYSVFIPKLVNFQTQAGYAPTNPNQTVNGPGGYAITQSKPLPKRLWPSTTVYYTIGDNNGQMQVTDLSQPITDLTLNSNPVLLLCINYLGYVFILGAGTLYQLIPAGGHTLLPTSFLYTVQCGHNWLSKPLSSYTILQSSFTNLPAIQLPHAQNDGIRDTHVHDTFEDLAVWCWTSNANVADQAQSAMNVWVSRATVTNCGLTHVKKGKPITHFQVSPFAWDTGIAISRLDKRHVVASFGSITYDAQTDQVIVNHPYSMASHDGGKTFEAMVAVDPTINGEDVRGVFADLYGNFWYSTSDGELFESGAYVNNIILYFSSDNAKTWTKVYESVESTTTSNLYYDYTQVCVTKQGVYFVADFNNYDTGNEYPALGFIPCTGLGIANVGPVQLCFLPQFQNTCCVADICVNQAGAIFVVGEPVTPLFTVINGATFAYSPVTILTAAAGQPFVAASFTGPGSVQSVLNALQTATSTYPVANEPFTPLCINGIVYVEEKHQLIVAFSEPTTPDGNDFAISLVVSYDDGVTWSGPKALVPLLKNNRGFQSIAYNPKYKQLISGWYDAKNSRNDTELQFFGNAIALENLQF